MAQNQKKYLYEEVSKVWYNNEVFNKGGVKYPEFAFHVYLSSGMALKQEAKPSARTCILTSVNEHFHLVQ